MKSVRQKINEGAYNNEIPYRKDTVEAYRAREAELLAQFWADVEREYDAAQYVLGKWRLLRRIAWEQGHSSGLSEVLYWIDELIDLIQPED